MNFEYHTNERCLELVLRGDYLNFDDEAAKSAFYAALHQGKLKSIKVLNDGLKQWDSSLVVVLFEAAKEAAKRQIDFDTQSLPQNLQRLLHLALAVDRKPTPKDMSKEPILEALGGWTLSIWQSIVKGTTFIHETFFAFQRLLINKAVMRQVDFLFALEDCSYKAVGIVSLVSFMVGLILAFVGAIQLKDFGAQIYVASLVAIGMTRIMGAIMVGIIMAGRTGASYAATIGTMQVNEEVDALKTMGISPTDFLVLPRITALTVTMPFLTLLADFMGIIGGAFVGVVMLDISAPEYYKYTLKALGLTNFWVGIFHGFVFGIVIALCGCYYGINCGRNADSVGVATTRAVVSAIVWMIVVTGLLTLMFEVMGI